MAANTYEVTLTDNRVICFSYGVAVAAYIPGRGYIRNAQTWSKTTSAHANAFAGKDSPTVAPAEFDTLIAPVEKGSR